MEDWKPVFGYEGFYEVSSLGRVKRVRSYRRNGFSGYIQPERILTAVSRGKSGYVCVGMSKHGKTVLTNVHRLVATAFIDNPENKPQVNHKNGDKTDCRLENLEWCTAKENAQHAIHKLKIKKNTYGLKFGAECSIKRSLNITNGEKVFQTYEEIYEHVYKNAEYAAKNKRAIQNGVKQCCDGVRKTSYGEKWAYVNEPVSTIHESVE